MLRIGLTGGIGSGKSVVAQIFEVLGIPVYYADDKAKSIMNEDAELRAKIIDVFGEEAYVSNQLNRSYIAAIVFKNKEKLNLLNSIVHPATINDSERWMKEQTSPYVIKEAALIFESGVDKHLDYVIGVSAPVSLRIQRVTSRDHISSEEVRRRIENQMDEEDKMMLCDFVITNDEQQLVTPQVLELHQKFLQITGN